MEDLIKESKNLNLADKFGTTPLHLSVMFKNEEVLDKLLDKNVDMFKVLCL